MSAEKILAKVPQHLHGHISVFLRLDTSEKIAFMLNKELRKQWHEDIRFVGEYLTQTPNKARIQQRQDVLNARKI